jgi:protocatechuate 3,4-dioxygenase beta subunit
MNRALAILLNLFVALSLFAQADTPATIEDKTSASIQGVVVKDPGDQPLKKATVQVVGEDDGASAYTAVSDAEGRFEISSLQPGRYRIFVERTGFIEVDKNGRRLPGAALSLQAGQSVKDFQLRMLPAAVVTGRVVDQDGDPMANVEISVLHYGYSSGRRELEQERSERTNDVGEFRIGGLLTGRYFISASPAPDFSSAPAAKESDENVAKTDLGYVTTYYPGTTDRTQATPLELHPGDEVPIDFTLVPTRTFRVRGSVASARGSGDAMGRAVVMLHPKEFNEIFSAAEVAKDGNFEIRGVAPGSYTITVMRSTGETAQVTHQDLEVVAADVNNLRLVPMQGSQIHGQLQIENSRRSDVSQLAVLLRPKGGNDNGAVVGSEQGRVKADGSFELQNVSPGTYMVTVAGGSRSLRDYFLKKVIAAGRDVTDTGLVVPSGAAFSMNVIVSPAAASILGTVLDDKNQPVGNATVVAVPDPSHQGQLDRYQQAMSDQRGHFTLHGLSPGSYTVFAWEHVEEGAYYDPDFLKDYEQRGETVRLAEGARQTVLLKVLSAAN